MKRVIGSAALSAFAVLALAGAAQAQSAYDYYNGASPLEGAYVGAYTGGTMGPGVSGTVGVTAGANFKITDNIMVGAEAQGGVAMGTAGTQYDALMLAKGGVLVAPDAMVYGTGGLGVVNGNNSWAAGVGGEVMASPDVGVRADVLGTGKWGSGLSHGKVTAGAVWHFK